MKQWIFLFIAAGALLLTACNRQEEITEVNYPDSYEQDNQDDEGSDYADIFDKVQNDWGPVVPFDFDTDVDMDLSMWMNMEQDTVRDNAVFPIITTVVSLIIGFVADGCTIARRAWERKYRTTLRDVEAKCQAINSSLSQIYKSLNQLQHNLENHLNRTASLIDELNLQMQLLDQQKRITFITDAILKKNGTLLEFVDGDFINYAEVFRLMDDYMGDESGKYDNPVTNREYHQLLYGMLNDWAGDGNKRLMDVFNLGNTLCGITFVTQQGTLVGMPAFYDQLTFDIKPWEHEGVENRCRLRLMDIMVWLQCEQMVAGYLTACQTLGLTAHGVDPYQLEESFNQLCRQIAALYADIPIHARFRICQVAGAHMIFPDTVIQEINYDAHLWYPVPLNSQLDEEKMVFDFQSIGEYITRNRQMPAAKAKRLLDYYHSPSYTMVDSILAKHGSMTVRDISSTQRTGEKRLLLNADVSSVKMGDEKWEKNSVYARQAYTAHTAVSDKSQFVSPILYYCVDNKENYVDPYPTKGSQYGKRVQKRIYYIDVR